jgi:hypothetical protein
MATIAGTNAILYLGLNSGSAGPITETFDLSVETETDFADDSAHGDVWRTFLPTLSTFTMSINKHFDDAAGGGQLQNWVIGRNLLRFYLYPARTTSTIYFYGTGYLGGGGIGLTLEDIADSAFTFQPSGQPGYIHP